MTEITRTDIGQLDVNTLEDVGVMVLLELFAKDTAQEIIDGVVDGSIVPTVPAIQTAKQEYPYSTTAEEALEHVQSTSDDGLNLDLEDTTEEEFTQNPILLVLHLPVCQLFAPV